MNEDDPVELSSGEEEGDSLKLADIPEFSPISTSFGNTYRAFMTPLTTAGKLSASRMKKDSQTICIICVDLMKPMPSCLFQDEVGKGGNLSGHHKLMHVQKKLMNSDGTYTIKNIREWAGKRLGSAGQMEMTTKLDLKKAVITKEECNALICDFISEAGLPFYLAISPRSSRSTL